MWKPIETASKKIKRTERHISGDGEHQYGRWVLLYPYHGEVVRGRWWQSTSGTSNFLTCGGMACNPTHWMPLPEPPK